ncbi:hypothetical protein KIN20_022099 [Parelaphostrongylus tenuis]|uniref:Uncharacterized protein n=1 Tax=Parelaphostrongylus tenuis TaxID=148309 RepID=A0AAD5QWK2_PARTN|nr:hypothetical protein KIN20_022099 [Parelaphostrongylus tenuis]
MEDDRFTDTILRNTSVQSAIERFDQRKPAVVQNRGKSSKTASPEGTTSVLTYDSYHELPPMQPVPSPRKAPSSSSPPHETTSVVVTSANKFRNLTREESLRFNSSATELIHPCRDDVIYHPMKPTPHSSPLSHIGEGITGMYQQQPLNTSLSEDDGYRDEVDVLTATKDSAPGLPIASITTKDFVDLSSALLMKQVGFFLIRALFLSSWWKIKRLSLNPLKFVLLEFLHFKAVGLNSYVSYA